jgi:hypothetical protein
LARWEDVANLLKRHGDARDAQGFTVQRFRWGEGGIDPVEEAIPVLALGDGRNYVCAETGGAPVWGPGGQRAEPLGLNRSPIATLLRELAFPELPAGAAHVRWPDGRPRPTAVAGAPFGVLAFLRQTVRAQPPAGWVEQGSSLHCVVLNPGSAPVHIEGEDKGELIRGLVDATVRVRPEGGAVSEDLIASLRASERQIGEDLRRPSEAELADGLRHAVIPLLAAVVG